MDYRCKWCGHVPAHKTRRCVMCGRQDWIFQPTIETRQAYAMARMVEKWERNGRAIVTSTIREVNRHAPA